MRAYSGRPNASNSMVNASPNSTAMASAIREKLGLNSGASLATLAAGLAAGRGAGAGLAGSAQQLEEGYPVGSDHGAITDAKPEIWENWDDFASKLGDLKRESQALADTAAKGDRAAMEAGFGKLGGTCKACHDEYKAD